MMAQACSTNYLGGGEREDHGSRSAQAKSLWDPILTNDWVWLCVPVIPEAQAGRSQSRLACE
jgi:hypothetical protein